jgi:flagellar protein FliS
MMNTGSHGAAKAYQQIGIKSEVESATPHRLIQLMMERVLTKIAMARGHMERESVAEKGAHIGSAVEIISGLQASLNHKPDQSLDVNFDALYEYMM